MSEQTPSSAPSQRSRDGARRSIKSARVAVAPERVSASSGEPLSSDVKDKFDLRGLLGEGGMGSVFIAQDRRLGRVVALKMLRAEYGSDADLLRRFALEAQVGAQLEHPNIVPLYSLERAENGGPAFAMQLVEGTTMGQYIYDASIAPAEARAPNGEYSLKKRLAKLLGACDALQFAHARGVIHRDIKPENIMLGEHHEVFVMDWGLARVTVAARAGADETSDAGKPAPRTYDLAPTVAPTIIRPPNGKGEAASVGLAATVMSNSEAPPGVAAKAPASVADSATQVGAVMGTYQYMPPEQAMGVVELMGPAADQYALGIILLELGTLQWARSVASMAEAQSQALLNQYRADNDVDGKPLDPALMAIVKRATEQDVAKRYPSVDAMAEDVRRFIRDEPVSVYREGIAKRALRQAARHPIMVMCGLTAVLLLGAASVVASFAASARAAQRATQDLQGLKRLLVAVQSRAHEVDVHLSDYATSLERVGAVAREILSDGANASPAAAKAVAALPAPALKWNERSHTPLNFHASLITYAGRANGAAPPLSLPAVQRIAPWLRDALAANLPRDVEAASEAAQVAALEAGKSPLLRIYLGLADGVYAQYPARSLPDSYDVRKRQWYHMAVTSRGLGWHEPIASPDGGSLRLPALLPLSHGGQLLGAVGGDLRVDELAEQLLLPDMPGFVDAYLVTEQGKVAVRRGLAAQVLKPGRNPDADVPLPSLFNAKLAARIAAGDQGGYVESGARLLLFVRMVSPAWYYVAEFEREPYLSEKLSKRDDVTASLSQPVQRDR